MFRRKKRQPVVSEPKAEPAPNLLSIMATAVYGGWLPMTNLHLQELRRFLQKDQGLDDHRWTGMAEWLERLKLTSVRHQVGYLDYLVIEIEGGIELRVFEDGLYVLEMQTNDPVEARVALQQFSQAVVAPMLMEVLDLSLPVIDSGLPGRELGSILLGVQWPHPNRFDIGQAYGSVRYSIVVEEVGVYVTDQFIFVVSANQESAQVRDLMEMQLFFQQFELNLGRYLQLQRQVLGQLEALTGSAKMEAGRLDRAEVRLQRWQQLASLAEYRLEQMVEAVQVRHAITEELLLDGQLRQLFHYRFENLLDTAQYVSRSWQMTGELIGQAFATVRHWQNKVRMGWLPWLAVLLLLLTLGSMAQWSLLGLDLPVESASFVVTGAVLLVALVVILLVNLFRSQSELVWRSPADRGVSPAVKKDRS